VLHLFHTLPRSCLGHPDPFATNLAIDVTVGHEHGAQNYYTTHDSGGIYHPWASTLFGLNLEQATYRGMWDPAVLQSAGALRLPYSSAYQIFNVLFALILPESHSMLAMHESWSSVSRSVLQVDRIISYNDLY